MQKRHNKGDQDQNTWRDKDKRFFKPTQKERTKSSNQKEFDPKGKINIISDIQLKKNLNIT